MEHEFSTTEKRKQLSDVKDEVNGFHPLLENVFGKIPRIENVAYTHGKDEWGADFILTRKDDLLDLDEYIGVIVKIGKIHQDLTNIEKQIDECDEERIGPDGKKKIRLDEIWVVSNDNITPNAEKSIHRKYSTRKIKFFRGRDVVGFIDKYIPSFWYEVPIKIGEHLRYVESQIAEIENLSSLLSNNSHIYIDQEITEGEWSSEKQSKKKAKHTRRNINILDEVDNNKVIFIEAEAGYGKSKLIRRLATTYCKPKIYLEKQYVPFFVSYKELCEEYNSSFEEFTLNYIVESKLGDYGDSGFVYFVDGVDERKSDNETHLETLNSLIEQVSSSDNCRVVFATRPIGILDESEEFKRDVKKFEVKPLTASAVIGFFQKFIEQVGISSRILKDLQDSPIFSQLPKSPIAAILLANLIQENHNDLPSNLTELYSKYLELMLGRWDIKKGINTDKEYEATKSIVCNISKHLIDHNIDSLSEPEALFFFKDFLAQRNLGIDAKELFYRTILRSNVLIMNESKGLVSFKHRTFCEFFYALHSTGKSSNFRVDDHCFNYYWKNIYFFYIGLLKDCEDVLEEVLNVKVEDTLSQFYKVIYMGDYFLAGYKSPYRVVEKYLPQIFKEATTLYSLILNNKIDTPFSEMPPIEVLWFFQMILRKEYGYEFFKKAVSHTALTIDGDSSMDLEHRIFSLFFLATTAMEFGENEPFKYLVSQHGSDINVLLAEGVRNEIKRLSSPSVDEKKYLKKVERRLQSTVGARQLVRGLYEVPIQEIVKSKN